MRIQLILLSLIISFNVSAMDNKSINDLFKKYELIMNEKRFELIDDVFSPKFIKDNGGKVEFMNKVKTLPLVKNKKSVEMSWKKGVRTEIYFVKYKRPIPDSHGTEFIVIKESEKLKIDGTLSDSN